MAFKTVLPLLVALGCSANLRRPHPADDDAAMQPHRRGAVHRHRAQEEQEEHGDALQEHRHVRKHRDQALAGYSAEGQDQWVLEMKSTLPKGPLKFLEIGARDGDFFSNTRKLEENGWSGTCIEPFPTNFEKFHRTCNLVKAALVGEKVAKRMFANCEDGSGITGWSGFTGDNPRSSQVRGCTQTEVQQVLFNELSLPPVLDYVSIDIEGLEMEILKTIPSSFCSRLWTIEGAGYEPQWKNEPITAFMAAKGCTRVKQSWNDGFYTCPCNGA